MSLPKTIGLFRLTRDAELRYGASGTAIVKLGLAASEKYGDKETQLFIDATAFGKQAEIISQYAGQKGNQIFITGRLSTESWEKDGQKHSKQTITIESFDFVSSGKKPEAPQSARKRQEMPQNNLPEIDVSDDIIPF